jgi:phosphodiesterase/alkaline phosphatase D-like protein
VQAAYRQQFAHPILPLADCGARSWVIGRVRFIQTDETVLASAKAATDNSSKTKLGTTQKAWFKAEIDAAVAAGQAVVWFGDGPWITPTGNGSSNEWAFYNTERTELGTYITTSGVRMIRLHGDAHTLFNDNGANNNWGAFPTACGAPIHTTAQTYGYTISGSRWPTATTNGSRHYGIVDVADNGTTITFTIHGWSSTVAAPTEVERFTETVVYTVTTPAPAGEARATIMRRGDGRRGTVTSKARRVIS